MLKNTYLLIKDILKQLPVGKNLVKKRTLFYILELAKNCLMVSKISGIYWLIGPRQ